MPAQRVVFHLGTPSILQELMWQHREPLAQAGFFYSSIYPEVNVSAAVSDWGVLHEL